MTTPEETARVILRLADEPDVMVGDHVRLARAYLEALKENERLRAWPRKLLRLIEEVWYDERFGKGSYANAVETVQEREPLCVYCDHGDPCPVHNQGLEPIETEPFWGKDNHSSPFTCPPIVEIGSEFVTTLDEDLERLREALRDLGYELAKATGILWLTRKFGMKPKRWVREREAHDEWKRWARERARDEWKDKS